VVFEGSPRYDHAPFLAAAMTIWATGTGSWVESVAAATGRTPGPDTLETSIMAVYEAGKRITAFDYQTALIMVNAACRQVAPFFATCDVLMTPTCAQPAWPLGELDANAPGWTLRSWTEEAFRRTPFTMLFNATGQPAVSLPLAMSPDGLPIGIQFVGQWGDEATLYRVAGQLERAQPWAARRPAVCA
jgi:amidase